MGEPGWLEGLAVLAEEEPWGVQHTNAPEPKPILKSYVRHTFGRLQEMTDGVGFSADGKLAAFNTGLVTPNQEEILRTVSPEPDPNGSRGWPSAGAVTGTS